MLGIAGGLLALVISALGIRGDLFKTKWQGRAVIALFALVLGGALGSLWTSKGEGDKGEAKAAKQGGAGEQIPVSEVEYKINVPGGENRNARKVTFAVTNDGKVPHDLVVEGPGAKGLKTPVANPGKTEELTVALQPGNYTLYCSVDGHRKLGMETQLKVH